VVRKREERESKRYRDGKLKDRLYLVQVGASQWSGEGTKEPKG
jgi:hypothetical protein